MRAVSFVLLGVLAVSAAGCFPANAHDAILGRWQSTDYPNVCCEFTEEETVRLWGDFGHAVGSYVIEENGTLQLNVTGPGRDGGRAVLQAALAGNTLTLETPDGRRVRLQRP